MARKTDHYFSEKPESDNIAHEFTCTLLGNGFKFHTASGVFSIKRIDRGTEVLIDNCIVKDGTEILDLCSGYGPVGIALAKRYPSIKVTMLEINERAVRLAKKNVEENSLRKDRFTVMKSDLYAKAEGMEFDTIVVNPPHTAGKDICIELIRQSPKYLKTDGTFQLVARHNKGGKGLAEEMKTSFGNVEEVAKGSGYRVYLSRKEKNTESGQTEETT